MPAPQKRSETGSFSRSAGLLAAGVGTAGLLTYVYFAVASHNLDAESYGGLVVLWSAVFITISVAHRPVELLLSRTLAERRARGEETASALRAAAVIQAAVAAVLALAVLALREPLEEGLLDGSSTLYWVLLVAVVAFGASFYARGLLAGSRRFTLLAGLLVCESAARLAFALVVAIGLAEGETAVALGVAAAPLFSLLVVPLALARRRPRTPAPPPPRDAERVSVGHGGRFAAGVLVVMLGEQILLNAGPLLMRAFEGREGAGFIFNVLMLARAPLLVFQGVATSLLPHLTRLRARGAHGADAFRQSISLTLRAVWAFAAFVALVVAVAGPELMQIAFGAQFEYDRTGLLIVTAGMGTYLSATTLNQAVLARGGARRAGGCWAVAAAAFLAWCLLPLVGDEALRIELGFTGAAALLALLLALALRAAPAGPGPAPGSPDEIEARLVQADEVS